jgi:hypothetical protein
MQVVALHHPGARREGFGAAWGESAPHQPTVGHGRKAGAVVVAVPLAGPPVPATGQRVWQRPVQVRPGPQYRGLVLERTGHDLLADLGHIGIEVARAVIEREPAEIGGRRDGHPVVGTVQSVQMNGNHQCVIHKWRRQSDHAIARNGSGDSHKRSRKYSRTATSRATGPKGPRLCEKHTRNGHPGD